MAPLAIGDGTQPAARVVGVVDHVAVLVHPIEPAFGVVAVVDEHPAGIGDRRDPVGISGIVIPEGCGATGIGRRQQVAAGIVGKVSMDAVAEIFAGHLAETII